MNAKNILWAGFTAVALIFAFWAHQHAKQEDQAYFDRLQERMDRFSGKR